MIQRREYLRMLPTITSSGGRAIFSAFLVAAAMGCGSDKATPSGSRPRGGAASASAPSGTASVLTGAAPTLPAPLAKLTFGASKADALAALGQPAVEWEVDGIEYELVLDHDRVVAARVRPAQKPLEVLPGMWGAPVTNHRGDSFWFAPATGIRAVVGKKLAHLVEFSAYQPLAPHVGTAPFALAFAAGKPLLGATVEELKAAWGAALCRLDKEAAEIEATRTSGKGGTMVLSLCWPAKRTLDTAWLNRPDGALPVATEDTIAIGQDGKAFGYTFSAEISPDLRASVLADLDAAFGTAEELTLDDRTIRTYAVPAKKLRAEATISATSVNVTVSTYLPLTELLSSTSGAMSIETPSMIGGTIAKIAAEVGPALRQDGELATIDFPGTEYNARTEVDLNRWADAPKVHAYSTTLHFPDRPARGDEIMTLLTTTFGASKPDPRSTAEVPYLTFKKNGRTITVGRHPNQIYIEVSK